MFRKDFLKYAGYLTGGLTSWFLAKFPHLNKNKKETNNKLCCNCGRELVYLESIPGDKRLYFMSQTYLISFGIKREGKIGYCQNGLGFDNPINCCSNPVHYV